MYTEIKVSELSGTALDWAVAKCEGHSLYSDGINWGFEKDGKSFVISSGWAENMTFMPSSNWAQGGPIVEREGITISSFYAQVNAPTPDFALCEWAAWIPRGHECIALQRGESPLIAAMRCYVTSKLGEIVNVPSELLK